MSQPPVSGKTSNNQLDQPSSHPYDALSQDKLIDWLESLDIDTDYRIYPLNSYENRVYRVGIEEASPIVVKVYRPERWTEVQIREELDYTQWLFEQEISVVPAMRIKGDVLHQRDGFFFACFEMRAGHAFELDNPDKLYRIGQLLGRMHMAGKQGKFKHRPTMSIQQPIQDAYEFFSRSDLIPQDIRANYLATLDGINKYIPAAQALLEECDTFRIHGDFHAGNILTRDEDILLVDFDDTVRGPAMQDVWKLLSGNAQDYASQLSEIEEGYDQFLTFPKKELKLIEPLRTSHMVKHTLWIAKRWQDPAFPVAFPWFGTSRYWSEHLLSLREQWATLQESGL